MTGLEIRTLYYLEDSLKNHKELHVTVRDFVKAIHISKDTLYGIYGGKDSLIFAVQGKFEKWLNGFVSVQDGMVRLVPSADMFTEYVYLICRFPGVFSRYLTTVPYDSRKPFSSALEPVDLDDIVKGRVFFCLCGLIETVRMWTRHCGPDTEFNESEIRRFAETAYPELKRLELWINGPTGEKE